MFEKVRQPDVIPSAMGYVDSTPNSKKRGIVPLTNSPPKMHVRKSIGLEKGSVPAHIKVKMAKETVAPANRAITIFFMCLVKWSANLWREDKMCHVTRIELNPSLDFR